LGEWRSEDSGAGPEDYYRVLVQQAADGIFISTDEGKYLDVNASGHRLLGYEPGELIGKYISDVLPVEEVPRLREAVAELLRGHTHVVEWSMLRKDGSLLDAEVTAQKLGNGAMVAVVRDIGPRKRIEEKIRASEAQLRSILLTAPDVILTANRAGTILFINRTLPQHNIETVIGSSCYDYVPADSRPRVAAAIEHVFTTRLIDEYEVMGPDGGESGERLWISVRVGPLIDGDRVIAATFCATDVTERKRDEARRRELFERLQKIASQLPGLVFQYRLRPDGSSCFPYMSERLRDIYGVSPEDVVDDASKMFELVYEDDRADLVESIARSARTMSPWQLEYRVTVPRHGVRWHYGSAVPERQPDGSTLWHGFITDIDQRKEAEVLKIQLESQLRQSQKVESIGRLAGGVAHDFNNLLSSVLGYSELALRTVPKGSDAAANIECVVEAAQRGAALTQQLLAYARKKVVKPEVLNLNDVLRRMAPMIRRLVGEHLEVIVSLAPELGMTKVDVGSLEQVIMNLIVNARDAISEGGRIELETSNVELRADDCRSRPESVPGQYVVMSVRDTGCGMTPEVMTRLFEPFFTTKPPGQGTGLGLAMCQGIVKQAGGNISVDGEPGQGSTFRIYLPRVAGWASSTAGIPADAASVGGHETLLLVEDEKMIVRVARESLSRFGYQVITASDGVQALEVAAATPQRIHLVITDVIMPNMGGRELAARLEALRPGIKVLFSSGYPANAIAAHGVLEDGINFIQKPYTPSALAARVRQVLDQA
jgi:two-component system cell cycle sensor histidine kinase/response regulator CckA